jgi:hypothetical protein
MSELDHTRRDCWKKGDSSGGPRAPIRKGDHPVVSHSVSVTTVFIPKNKLIFCSRTKSSSEYYSEINCAMFRKWFQEQMISYLAPQSIMIQQNTSIPSVVMERLDAQL